MAKLDFEQRQEAQGVIDLATDEDALADAIYKLIDERDTALARGRAEGAEAIKKTIRDSSQMCGLVVTESVGRDESGNEVTDKHVESVYAVLPFLLAPATKEDDNGNA